MAANKVRGIRCALCWNEETARLSRQHNDANVLSLGERMIPEDLALKIVRVWLTTDFEGGRHIARIAQLEPVDDLQLRLQRQPQADEKTALTKALLWKNARLIPARSSRAALRCS